MTETTPKSLKMDLMAEWMQTHWLPQFGDQACRIVAVDVACTNDSVLSLFPATFGLAGGYHFAGTERIESGVVLPVDDYALHTRKITDQTGAFVHEFNGAAGARVQILVMCAHYSDSGYHRVALAAVPEAFLPAWYDFAGECYRLAYSYEPEDRVVIIGGHSNSFQPTVSLEDVVLPPALKEDILGDIRSFFQRGVEVYRRLKLKPFRKLLLAGVPGTGKTMLCAALAKWALEHKMLVIYVSSARKRQGEDHGSSFSKIEYALATASRSKYPSIILLEEMDAYLHDDEKALILNVLDGSESVINDRGTLLIATTNYPEAIDERIMKRPGRLDRIFIIPETKSPETAGRMLRQYLGTMWHDEHETLVERLVGYPGAFIREVAVYALTQVACQELNVLPLALLEESYQRLKEQLEVRDDFLSHPHRSPHMGFAAAPTNGQHAVPALAPSDPA
ncbi:MAG: ATP-binding protein [Anaerolineae bacterium]|nr:ATP-binding protein [Anaerolineae bacterium]